jgi:hypothetical protein
MPPVSQQANQMPYRLPAFRLLSFDIGENEKARTGLFAFRTVFQPGPCLR